MADARPPASTFPVEPGFPVEEVARLPLPGLAHPVAVAFSPDGGLVTYLHAEDGSLTRRLYALDVETGERWLALTTAGAGVREEDLSLEERLRRERARDLGLGVTTYAWAEEADRILVPLADGVHVQDGARPGAPIRKVVDAGDGPVLDPKLSPDGSMVGFVQDAELYVVPADGAAPPRQLTQGARGTGRTHGLAEYIAQEEMGRGSGWWWSPDSRRIAFCMVDETHIPVYRIVHQGSALVGEGAQEDHRYPFSGGPNAKVRLGVIGVGRTGGAQPASRPPRPRWLETGTEEGEAYLAKVQWGRDGLLYAQVESRDQTELTLLAFDPVTGERTVVLEERGTPWLNLHDLFRPLADGRCLWASESSGFRHLTIGGETLTAGQWVVDAVEAVDEKVGVVYLTGNRASPVERHLYAVPLTGGEPVRLTPEPGSHTVVVDHERGRFVDTHSALDRPPTVTVRSLDDGRVLHAVFDERDPRVDRLGLRPPERLRLTARDGTTLYGALFRPTAGAPPWPTIVQVYGGPHAQLVTDSWAPTAAMRAQFLRQAGFAVLVLDNRGGARRGLAFEAPLHHALGGVEVDDQVDGVRFLVGAGLCDPTRVGINGWSYGGYLAAMCLARAPQVFRAAVAGAPVIAWDGYDTHYTERYMGTPQADPAAYERSSVLAHVSAIRGSLLVVHGLIDENVHFRHTARLVNALVAAGVPYELLLFPDERHVPRREEDRVYMERRISGFLAGALAPG